jgi:hypothetical protein
MNRSMNFFPNAMMLTILGGASLGIFAMTFLGSGSGKNGLSPSLAKGKAGETLMDDDGPLEMLFI